jgi:hypothetical protein
MSDWLTRMRPWPMPIRTAPRGRDNRVRRRGHPASLPAREESGKEVRLPSPPPLRTVHAPFDAYGSSIGQRLYGTRRGLPIGLGADLDGTTAEPATEDRRGPHHGRCRPRQIGFAPRAGWLSVPIRRHPGEVGSLSRGVISQPLSDPLRAGLRFLPRPLPAAPSARLAAGLPSREDDGLTTLHRRNPRGLGPALTPVALHLRRMSLQHPDLATYRFGPSLSAPLACLCLRRLRRFTWVGHTTRPWSPTAAVLAVAISARAPIATLAGEDTLSRGLRTPPLPATHASVGDCWQNSRCRHLLLEEQHTSRDTLVSHAGRQEETFGDER